MPDRLLLGHFAVVKNSYSGVFVSAYKLAYGLFDFGFMFYVSYVITRLYKPKNFKISHKKCAYEA